jgi:hypothetical protein
LEGLEKGGRQGFGAAQLSGWWWEGHSMLPSVRPHIFRANDNRHNVFSDPAKPIVVLHKEQQIHQQSLNQKPQRSDHSDSGVELGSALAEAFFLSLQVI